MVIYYPYMSPHISHMMLRWHISHMSRQRGSYSNTFCTKLFKMVWNVSKCNECCLWGAIYCTYVTLVSFPIWPIHARVMVDFQHNAFDHDDVTKWKHFPRYWSFVRGIHWSPVNSPHKGQWRGTLIFPLICASINGWVSNRDAGDLRRYGAHYDVTVMSSGHPKLNSITGLMLSRVKMVDIVWQHIDTLISKLCYNGEFPHLAAKNLQSVTSLMFLVITWFVLWNNVDIYIYVCI